MANTAKMDVRVFQQLGTVAKRTHGMDFTQSCARRVNHISGQNCRPDCVHGLVSSDTARCSSFFLWNCVTTSYVLNGILYFRLLRYEFITTSF
jgi:hypothetical protein